MPNPVNFVPVRASLLAAFGVVLHATRFRDVDWAIDDAWISFAVARNVARGQGFVFDPTEPPIESVTNVGWTLLVALWMKVFPSVEPIVFARALGLLCGALSAALVVYWVGRMLERDPRQALVGQAAAALWLCSTGTLAYHAASGLETGAWLLALAGVGYGLWSSHETGRTPWAAGIVLASTMLLRPEAVLVAAFVAGVWLASRRPGLHAIVVPSMVVLAGLEAWRLLTFGSLVPNTFFAKPPDWKGGLDYARRFAEHGLAGGGALFLLTSWRSWPRSWHWAILFAVVWVVAMTWSGGDWMWGWRRLLPVDLVLAGTAGLAIGGATGAARALGVAGLVLGMLGHARAAFELSDSVAFPYDRMEHLGAVAARTPGIERVALLDAGRFGWAFDGPIYDIAGLTDAHIARLPGAHAQKAWDETYFRARSPELLVVRTTTPITFPLEELPRISAAEHAMLLSAMENGGYTYAGTLSLAPGMHIILYVEEGVALPPEDWGPPPTLTLEDMIREYYARHGGHVPELGGKW